MSRRLHSFLCICCVLLTAGFTSKASAVCARVVIQIEQELTLEREGFEARLGITNGLPSALEEVEVTLKFTDADGNAIGAYTGATGNTSDRFFYRVQTGFSAPTSVAAGAEQKLAYLIVPTPGAAGISSSGALYYVGATIKYKVLGEQQTIEVEPDYITVRPMPDLQLQYFLPGNVYGDDPMTETSEPIVPFPLGVRVVNHSAYASAKKVAIESGQPEIIDNQRGLLIDFRIVGCEVNGATVQPTLLASFGDIAPKRAAVGSWLMTSSLSGRFVKFTGEVSHAPEFGGALTSLIQEDAISTHRLIGKVRVDIAGRDAVTDFLGTDQMTGDFGAVKVYESDTDASGQTVDYYAPGSAGVSLSAQAPYTLSVDSANAMLFVRIASPVHSDQEVKAVRSDGKVLPKENCWISKNKDGSGQWEYWLNVFDTGRDAARSYALTFSDPTRENEAPVLTLVNGPAYSVQARQPLLISVTASDPEGLIPVLSTGDLPEGATFVDRRDGTGSLTWAPGSTQFGNYVIQFRASDGGLTDSKAAHVSVAAPGVSNFASWQNRFWPGVTDPAVIGQDADPDGDMINNLLEYALDLDPTKLDESGLPTIGLDKADGQSYLTLTYRKRTDDSTLRYEVVASENAYAPLASWVAQGSEVAVGQDSLPAGLQRVKVRDSVALDPAKTQRYLRLRVSMPSTQ